LLCFVFVRYSRTEFRREIPSFSYLFRAERRLIISSLGRCPRIIRSTKQSLKGRPRPAAAGLRYGGAFSPQPSPNQRAGVLRVGLPAIRRPRSLVPKQSLGTRK